MFSICQHLFALGGEMFYNNVGFYLEIVWLWRISGGCSHGVMWLTLWWVLVY